MLSNTLAKVIFYYFRKMDRTDIVKRERSKPIEQGDRVSVPRNYFGDSYGNTLKDSVSKLYGTVLNVFSASDFSVVWDVDEEISPHCKLRNITLEPADTPKQKDVFCPQDNQDVDQGCSADAVKTHSLLVDDFDGIDENFAASKQTKKTGKRKLRKEVKLGIDLDFSIEPIPKVKSNSKHASLRQRSNQIKYQSEDEDSDEEYDSNSSKDEKEVKGKNLEKVLKQMKKDRKDPKRESKRSLHSSQYREEESGSISVNDVLDKLSANEKWAAADIFITPPGGNRSDEDSAPSDQEFDDDDNTRIHHLSRNQLLAQCELQV